MDTGGIRVFPRFMAQPDLTGNMGEFLSTGVEALDILLGGGLEWPGHEAIYLVSNYFRAGVVNLIITIYFQLTTPAVKDNLINTEIGARPPPA
jgi:hypothetical protein